MHLKLNLKNKTRIDYEKYIIIIVVLVVICVIGYMLWPKIKTMITGRNESNEDAE